MAEMQQEEGEFTRSMRAVNTRFLQDQDALYKQHKDLERRYAAALHEIETLRADVQRLQRGEGIVIEIDGKKFTLSSGISKVDVTEMVTVSDAWLNGAMQPDGTLHKQSWMNDQPRQHDTQRLDDSYLLSRD